MRRLWLAAGVSGGALAVALAATAGTALGGPLLHYNVAFAALAVATVAGLPLLRRRRIASLLLLYAGILATVTGFLLLYLKDDLKTAGLKDWLKWWHSVTSVAFLGLFLLHWARNNARLVGFAERLLSRDRRLGLPVLGAWGVATAAGVWTWGTEGRALFTDENYLALSSWAILVGVSFAYGLWLLYRLPAWRARLAEPAHRNRLRSLVDTSMWLATWLALLTGFALLYFKDFLHGNGFKYVSKWWHTATSVAFVALVVLHVGFNARLLAAHARRVDAESGKRPPRYE